MKILLMIIALHCSGLYAGQTNFSNTAQSSVPPTAHSPYLSQLDVPGTYHYACRSNSVILDGCSHSFVSDDPVSTTGIRDKKHYDSDIVCQNAGRLVNQLPFNRGRRVEGYQSPPAQPIGYVTQVKAKYNVGHPTGRTVPLRHFSLTTNSQQDSSNRTMTGCFSLNQQETRKQGNFIDDQDQADLSLEEIYADLCQQEDSTPSLIKTEPTPTPLNHLVNFHQKSSADVPNPVREPLPDFKEVTEAKAMNRDSSQLNSSTPENSMNSIDFPAQFQALFSDTLESNSEGIADSSHTSLNVSIPVQGSVAQGCQIPVGSSSSAEPTVSFQRAGFSRLSPCFSGDNIKTETPCHSQMNHETTRALCLIRFAQQNNWDNFNHLMQKCIQDKLDYIWLEDEGHQYSTLLFELTIYPPKFLKAFLDHVNLNLKGSHYLNFQTKSENNTALMAAVFSGYQENVSALLKYNPNLKLANCHGFSAIHLVQNDSVLNALLEHDDSQINLRDHQGNTLLHYCACNPKKHTLALRLFQRGAVDNIQNNEGMLACHLLDAYPKYTKTEINHYICCGDLFEFFRDEKNIPQKIETIDEVKQDMSILHYAAYRNYLSIVTFLVEDLKVDINESTSKNSSTPLHMAILGKSEEVVDYLLAHYAKTDELDSMGYAPIHYCQYHDSHSFFDNLKTKTRINQALHTRDGLTARDLFESKQHKNKK